MKHSIQIDFDGFIAVTHLWPSLVDKLGLDRARKALRQGLDLRLMEAGIGLLPVLFSDTCGLALFSVDSFHKQTGILCDVEGTLLIVSLREHTYQLLDEVHLY